MTFTYNLYKLTKKDIINDNNFLVTLTIINRGNISTPSRFVFFFINIILKENMKMNTILFFKIKTI